MPTAVHAAANTRSGAATYARRVPEDTILYGVVADQLTTFFAHAESSGRTVPAFVERELTRYLECGILADGFVRVRCSACRYDRVVAFSCKGRGFCPIVLDGVYQHEQGGAVRFRRLPPPTNADVEQTTRRIVRRLRRLLIRRGLTPDADVAAADSLTEDQPLLAEIYAASVRSRIAIGERAGLGVLRIGDLVDPEEAAFITGTRCTMIDGVSLHANVIIPAGDRGRLEKLCRYIARPPVSTERLSKLGDGRLLYRLKRRWRDGTTHVVFQPLELVEKLAAIVPPPRIHMIRYHGVLAPRAACRRQVVRAPDAKRRSRNESDETANACAHAPRRWTFAARWLAAPRAKLMQRVFAVDVLECPKCGGKMKILATIHPPEATTAILESLGMSPRAPPPAASSLSAGGEDMF